MTIRPKLETVAKEANVSTATASQVMRGTGRISQKTRKRVLEAAQKLHYVPDSRAAAMRSGQSREIGFTINQISNPFNAEVISGVSDLLESEGYLVSVLDARDDPVRQDRHLDAFIRNRRAGLIWVPALDTPDAAVDLLTTHRIPTVTFLRHRNAGRFDHVGIRNQEATRAATNHLADLGHRHIAYLGGVGLNPVRTQRIEGYKQIMAERDLPAPIIWESRDNKMDGLDALMALRDRHPNTTAIVCNGDTVALGACLALARSDLVPGKDMSVIGFDDIPESAVSTPPLTTMAVSPYQLGRRLARLLLDRIHEPDTPVTVSEISAELIVRKTTGPAPGVK